MILHTIMGAEYPIKYKGIQLNENEEHQICHYSLTGQHCGMLVVEWVMEHFLLV